MQKKKKNLTIKDFSIYCSMLGCWPKEKESISKSLPDQFFILEVLFHPFGDYEAIDPFLKEFKVGNSKLTPKVNHHATLFCTILWLC